MSTNAPFNSATTAEASGSSSTTATTAVLSSSSGCDDDCEDLTSCTDILKELYYYVIRERNVVSESLTIGHVVRTLLEEGIWFWRDERFEESQNVALALASAGGNSQSCVREKYTNKVSPATQTLVAGHKLSHWKDFERLVSPCARLFLRTFSEENVIPDWSAFCTDMAYHFYEAQPDTSGQTAQYIPILRDANPEKFGLAMCSIDGQRFTIGDTSAKFSLQSVSKPVTYALGLAKEGDEFMDDWIGVEPAGRPFNTQDLNECNCPFNSSVNSGAIMAAGVFASSFPDSSWLEVVDKVRTTWYKMCGNDIEVGFSQDTFESEKETAYNNFAIAYNLKGRRGLPRNVDLHKMLDVYLGCCSIEITCEALSVAAATLANGGVCPITNKEVFPAQVTRTVLAEMMTCGMYDQAGRFAVDVGIPSKSGVSGALMVIIPNLMGFATFSPRLNQKGNSVRGIAFCKKLVNSYRVHIFEPLRSGNTGAKIDPRIGGSKNERNELTRMSWAVEVGDRYARRLRDIFLFALCLTAAASPQGLSDHRIEAIKQNYSKIYQLDSDDKDVLGVIKVVKENPKSLRFLEELTRGVHIVDSHRSVVLLSMMDFIFADGQVGEIEKSVAIRIASLLGIDKGIALLEINRHARSFQKKIPARNESHHEFSEMIDADIHSSVRGTLVRSQSGESAPKRMRTGPSTSAAAGRAEDTLNEENVALKREIFRLRRKVALLTGLLDDRSKHHR